MCAIAVPENTADTELPFGITIFSLSDQEGEILGTAERFLQTQSIPFAVCGLHKKGAAIAVEIYELPVVSIGAFLQQVKKPLCIGDVELSDGRIVKGYLCEEYGLANAKEMDEPFSALDPQTKADMQLLMRQIWQEEKPTVIFVTHDIEEAVFLSSKIYVLTQRPGTVKAEVPVLLPYDRDLPLKDTDEFIKLRKKVNQLIEHESLS